MVQRVTKGFKSSYIWQKKSFRRSKRI